MKETESIMIGGREYHFFMMPPTVAFPLLVDLLHVFQADILDWIEEGEVDENMNLLSVLLLLRETKGSSLLGWMRSLLHYVRLEGKQIEMDSDFVGRNEQLFLVVLHALMVNFSGFLGESLANMLMQHLTRLIHETPLIP